MVLRKISNTGDSQSTGSPIRPVEVIQKDNLNVFKSIAATNDGSLITLDESQSMVVMNNNGSIIEKTEAQDLREPTSVAADPDSASIWTTSKGFGDNPEPRVNLQDRPFDDPERSFPPQNEQLNKVDHQGSGNISAAVKGAITSPNDAIIDDKESIWTVQNGGTINRRTPDNTSRISFSDVTSIVDPSNNSPRFETLAKNNTSNFIVRSGRYHNRGYEVIPSKSTTQGGVAREYFKFDSNNNNEKHLSVNNSDSIFYLGVDERNQRFIKRTTQQSPTRFKTSASSTSASNNFNEVRGINYSETENVVYVADRDRQSLFEFNASSGDFITTHGSNFRPQGVSTDSSGSIYIVNRNSSLIEKRKNPSGSVIDSVVSPTRFTDGFEIVEGSRFIAGGQNRDQIIQSPSFTWVSRRFDIPSPSGFNARGLDFDSNDSMWYVGDSPCLIKQTDKQGNQQTSFGINFDVLQGLAIDSSGSIFIPVSRRGRDKAIAKYNQSGNRINTVSSPCTRNRGIAINNQDEIVYQEENYNTNTREKQLVKRANGTEVNRVPHFQNNRGMTFTPGGSLLIYSGNQAYKAKPQRLFDSQTKVFYPFNKDGTAIQDVAHDSNASIFLTTSSSVLKSTTSGSEINRFSNPASNNINTVGVDTQNDCLFLGYDSFIIKSDQNGNSDNQISIPKRSNGLGIDSQGCIYVSNDRDIRAPYETDVHIFDQNGNIQNELSVSSFIEEPEGVAIDSNDSLFVQEREGPDNRVFKFDSQGSIIDDRFLYPSKGISIAPGGSISFAGFDDRVITTTKETIADEKYAVPFRGATRSGVAYDNQGSKWENGFMNGAISIEYAIDGLNVQSKPGFMDNLNRPGVDFDPVESLYRVVDDGPNSVFIFSKANDNISEPFELEEVKEPIADFPRGVSTTDDGVVWLFGNNRRKLYKVDKNYQVKEDKIQLRDEQVGGLHVQDDGSIYINYRGGSGEIVELDQNGQELNSESVSNPLMNEGNVSINNIYKKDGFYLTTVGTNKNLLTAVDESINSEVIGTAPSTVPTHRHVSRGVKTSDGAIWTVGQLIHHSRRNDANRSRFFTTPRKDHRQEKLARLDAENPELHIGGIVNRRVRHADLMSPGVIGSRNDIDTVALGQKPTDNKASIPLVTVNRGGNNIDLTQLSGGSERLRSRTINRFNAPSNNVQGLAMTDNGCIWLHERRNNRIYRFNQNGNNDTSFRPETSKSNNCLFRPNDLAYDDEEDNIYAATGRCIVIFNTNGNQEKIFTQYGSRRRNKRDRGISVNHDYEFARITDFQRTVGDFPNNVTVGSSNIEPRGNNYNKPAIIYYNQNGQEAKREAINITTDDLQEGSFNSFDNLFAFPNRDKHIINNTGKQSMIVVNNDGGFTPKTRTAADKQYRDRLGEFVVDVTTFDGDPNTCVALHEDGIIRAHGKSSPPVEMFSVSHNDFVGISERDGILHLTTSDGEIHKYEI